MNTFKHYHLLLLCLALTSLTSCEENTPDCIKTTFYQDADQDGRGNALVAVEACEQPQGFVANDTDDDDAVPCTNPSSWYADADNDGFGSIADQLLRCTQPIGYVGNFDDPDDSVPHRMLYQDFDGDGLGNPMSSIITSFEELPNYVGNAEDDNDQLGENLGEVVLHNPSLADDSYVLINELGTNRIRLIDKEGTTRSLWDLGSGEALANDAELLDDGLFLYTLKVDPPPFNQGGYGGKVGIMNAQKEVIWEYEMSETKALQHHDAERLPNGNILVMAWESKGQEDILEKGYIGEANSLNTESIYEINPQTNQIVWEWHAWDHLIQDQDESKPTYGALESNPQKINLNYVTDKEGFMHANGIDYDEERNLIFMSVRYYSEIWVIDHNTTTAEASTEKGDLKYRFGNPETYNGEGSRLFHWQHHPNFLEGNQIGKGNVLVFSNEHNASVQSAVLEVALPEVLEFGQQPSIVWQFTDTGLFSPILSGAERLPNGNTLITMGTQGSIWEVSPDKQVVWKFEVAASPPTRLWRSYTYSKGSNAIKAIGFE